MSWIEDNLLTPGETILHSVKVSRGELALTSRRLIYVKGGLLGRDVLDINLASIENVTVQQSLFGRLFNRGAITVGSGSGLRDMEIPNVPAPMEFRRQALAAVDALH